jgi:hypothetical protein
MCHLTWLSVNNLLPGNLPLPEHLERVLWYADLFPASPNPWKPNIPDIGDDYVVYSKDIREALIDAWKIGRKFVRPGDTRHDVAVRILHWFKSEMPFYGEFATSHPGASWFEETLTVSLDTKRFVQSEALLTLFRAVGIPAVSLWQFSADRGLPQIWLPEEHLFIDVWSLFYYPAAPATNMLLPPSIVAHDQDPTPSLVQFVMGKLLDVVVKQKTDMGAPYLTLYTFGHWPFSSFSPDEIAKLRREFPRLIGTDDFRTLSRLTFAQMTDPNFPLD